MIYSTLQLSFFNILDKTPFIFIYKKSTFLLDLFCDLDQLFEGEQNVVLLLS